MTSNTCYLLPLSAAEKIPSCNITVPRPKRAIPFFVNLGVGLVNTGLSVSNTIQLANLQKEIALVQKSLSDLSQDSQIIGAQLVNIQADQIRVIEQLQTTQQLIESMMLAANNHSHALNTLQTHLSLLQMQVQHSFLYQSIIQIFRNELTLAFLAPADLHKVVYDVIRQGNLSFNPHFGSLPLAHIVTQLLIRQQVDFLPSMNPPHSTESEIGRLIITSFFAVPRSNQSPFLVYKLLTTPFIHDNQTLQLAEIPRYLAIDPSKNVTIEWHDQTDSTCDFSVMTTCRSTPPFRSLSAATCLGQILNGLPLSKCATTPVSPSPFFLRQLRDNLWVTSSSQPLHCVIIPQAESFVHNHQRENRNEPLVLPLVALVNVTPETTVACPGFSLIGRPMEQSSPSVIILYNNTLFLNNISVLDIHHHITRDDGWFKVGLLRRNLMALIPSLSAGHPRVAATQPHLTHSPLITSLLIGVIFSALSIIAIIYLTKRYTGNLLTNLRLTIPPIPQATPHT